MKRIKERDYKHISVELKILSFKRPFKHFKFLQNLLLPEKWLIFTRRSFHLPWLVLFRLWKRLHSVFLNFERITTNLKHKACVKNCEHGVWKMLACFFYLELFFRDQNQGNSFSCFKFWPFFGLIWFKLIYLLHTNCFDSFAPIIVQILLQPKPVYRLLPCSVPTLPVNSVNFPPNRLTKKDDTWSNRCTSVKVSV